MVNATALQNLTRFDKLINSDGTPTDFFMRLLQGSNETTDGFTARIDHLDNFEIKTLAPIHGGDHALGKVAEITISHDDSGVTAPGPYGTATKVPTITVDEKGHVTDAVETDIDFTVEVENEGVSLGIFEKINFTGAGVTASDAGGGVADVDIPGGGGGGGSVGVIGQQEFALGGGGGGFSAGYCGLHAMVVPVDGTLTDIVCWSGTADGTVVILPGLYSNNVAHPDVLLATGPSVTGIAQGINIIPLAGGVAVTKGQVVWAAIQITGNTADICPAVTNTMTAYFASSGALPNPASGSAGVLTMAGSIAAIMA